MANVRAQGKCPVRKRPDLNLLKFIGMAVSVWLECLEADVHDCILAIGDNTSAVGWLHDLAHLDVKLAAHAARLVW